MAELIERLAGPTIGFSCFDFFVVARETFYDVSLFFPLLCLCSRFSLSLCFRLQMMILLGTQFFLMADFILSYL